jgi:hypothetical protein
MLISLSPPGTRLGRALRAGGLGALAAIGGSLVYSAVVAITGGEFGFVAILLGYMVGRAVRKGSGDRGGPAYQALAIGLTYLAIVSTYVPLIVKDFGSKSAKAAVHMTAVVPMDTITISASVPVSTTPDTSFSVSQTGAPETFARAQPHLTPSEAVFGIFDLLWMATKIPLIAGFSNLLGLLIIGIALFAARTGVRRVPRANWAIRAIKSRAGRASARAAGYYVLLVGALPLLAALSRAPI